LLLFPDTKPLGFKLFKPGEGLSPCGGCHGEHCVPEFTLIGGIPGELLPGDVGELQEVLVVGLGRVEGKIKEEEPIPRPGAQLGRRRILGIKTIEGMDFMGRPRRGAIRGGNVVMELANILMEFLGGHLGGGRVVSEIPTEVLLAFGTGKNGTKKMEPFFGKRTGFSVLNHRV